MDERQKNFKQLIRSYVIAQGNLDEATVESFLRQYAESLGGGCISCVYSRRYLKEIPESRFFWTKRTCVLGLSQSTCNEYLDFPPES